MALVKALRTFHERIHKELIASVRKPVALAWDDIGLHDAYRRLLAYGGAVASEEEFTKAVIEAANNTARSARLQVAKALGLASVVAPLLRQVDDIVVGMRQRLEERITASLDRARDVFRDWRTDDEADVGALETKLDEGLDGITGGAVAGVSLLFGSVWADMNHEVQVSAGVGSYIWVAQRDKFTRRAHAALDDQLCEWRSPPLKASESSNGEPCHPGDDFNCRCIAAPLLQ